MAQSIIHKAETRGHANHGWLDTYHTFSFANYYEPERIQFGALRVLNDDSIDGGMGFDMHPHDNMEIITIPLKGALEHQDSMGNHSVIKHGEIQVMSAGTGIFHSEFNHEKNSTCKLLQIWILPNKKGVTPRYNQIQLNVEDRHNRFQQILSPNADDAGVWIHQNTWFHLSKFDKGVSADYSLKAKGNGVYAFIISGDVTINGNDLKNRDGIGIWDTKKISIKANSNAEFLLMEVPM